VDSRRMTTFTELGEFMQQRCGKYHKKKYASKYNENFVLNSSLHLSANN